MAQPTAQKSVYVGTGEITVSRWSGNWENRLAETTTSGSGGGTRMAPTVTHPQWTAEFPQDDANYPEALGFTPGLVISTMYFDSGAKSGGNQRADKIVSTTIRSVEKATDSTSDVPRIVVRGEGGTLSYNQAIA